MVEGVELIELGRRIVSAVVADCAVGDEDLLAGADLRGVERPGGGRRGCRRNGGWRCGLDGR